MQILVLGMHRSGTSITARLINMMGAYFGPEQVALNPARDNPRGHWERRDVLRLNDAMLKEQGCLWYDLSEWDFNEAANLPQELQSALQKLVLGLDAHRPWFLKDPRLCLTLPVWLPLLQLPHTVLVYRNPAEIAVSLETRSQLPPHYSLALWEYYTVGALNASRGMPRLFVNHAELIKNPYKTCEKMFEQLTELGVRRLEMPSKREVDAFMDPALYRAKPATDAPLELTKAQKLLADMMQGKKPQADVVQVSKESEALMRSYFAAKRGMRAVFQPRYQE